MITYSHVLKYNLKFYDESEYLILQDIIKNNKKAIDELCFKVYLGVEDLPQEPNMKELRSNLKKKNKRFSINRDYNIGNLMNFGCSIDETNIQRILMIPKDNIDEDDYNAYLTFGCNKKMLKNFDRLKMALKSSKVRFSTETISKGKKYITFKVLNPLDNVKFWSIVKLWCKN